MVKFSGPQVGRDLRIAPPSSGRHSAAIPGQPRSLGRARNRTTACPAMPNPENFQIRSSLVIFGHLWSSRIRWPLWVWGAPARRTCASQTATRNPRPGHQLGLRLRRAGSARGFASCSLASSWQVRFPKNKLQCADDGRRIVLPDGELVKTPPAGWVSSGICGHNREHIS